MPHWRNLIPRYRKEAGLDVVQVRCLICGRTFKGIGKHSLLAHGITIREYKLRFALPLTVGVTSAETFKRNKNAGLMRREACSKLRRSFVPVGSRKRTSSPFQNARTRTAIEETHRVKREQTASQRTLFTNLWNAGTKVNTMASILGRSLWYITSCRKRYGLPVRHKPRSKETT